jgi:hypothetical protein
MATESSSKAAVTVVSGPVRALGQACALYPGFAVHLAAAFPDLTAVATYFGWLWHLDLVAMALHKTDVHLEIWAGRPADPAGGGPRAARPVVGPAHLGDRLRVHRPGTLR